MARKSQASASQSAAESSPGQQPIVLHVKAPKSAVARARQALSLMADVLLYFKLQQQENAPLDERKRLCEAFNQMRQQFEKATEELPHKMVPPPGMTAEEWIVGTRKEIKQAADLLSWLSNKGMDGEAAIDANAQELREKILERRDWLGGTEQELGESPHSAELDEWVTAQGLTPDALLRFADDQHDKPNWLPAGWKSEFWPAEPTLPAAVAWLRRATDQCEYFNLYADFNAQFAGVAGAGDYVHDAYRLDDRLDLVTEPGLPAKPDRAQWTWQLQIDDLGRLLNWVAQRLPKPAETVKAKRSTEQGEARAKLIAALTKHHQYADGSCLNLEPIGNNELARLAGVDKATASAFFEKQFRGHAKYRAKCLDVGSLCDALKVLRGEVTPAEFSRATLEAFELGKRLSSEE